jgi:phage repressor protein C with HTH and peptisase S24 domain
MDGPTTWRDVAARLSGKRGERAALTRALQMDRSFLARKLRTDDDLTTSQERAWKQFLDGSEGLTPTSANDVGSSPESGDRRSVPMYGYATASTDDHFAFNEGEVVDMIKLPMGVALGPGEYFAVQTLGSSMEPRLPAIPRQEGNRGIL